MGLVAVELLEAWEGGVSDKRAWEAAEWLLEACVQLTDDQAQWNVWGREGTREGPAYEGFSQAKETVTWSITIQWCNPIGMRRERVDQCGEWEQHPECGEGTIANDESVPVEPATLAQNIT
jgi:hypothetical protein